MKELRKSDYIYNDKSKKEKAMAKKTQVLHGQLLVTSSILPSETKGGLFIPESARQARQVQGEVLVVGIEAEGRLTQGRVGDIVEFNPAAGQEVEYEGQICLLIPEKAVLLFHREE